MLQLVAAGIADTRAVYGVRQCLRPQASCFKILHGFSRKSHLFTRSVHNLLIPTSSVPGFLENGLYVGALTARRIWDCSVGQ